MHRILFFIAILGISGLYTPPALAEDAPPAFRSTPYPIPRFVSLSSEKVYVRSGPGSRYPVKWVYKRNGLPVEVILEYEAWRKIKDIDGDEGWVHQSLTSGHRTGIIKGESAISLYQKPKDTARKNATLEPLVLVDISKCEEAWCKIEISGYKGWVERKYLWGVYESENFD